MADHRKTKPSKPVLAERKRIVGLLRKRASEYGWRDAAYVIDDEPLPVGKMCNDLQKIIKEIERG